MKLSGCIKSATVENPEGESRLIRKAEKQAEASPWRERRNPEEDFRIWKPGIEERDFRDRR
jgi:hypothetical protein